MLRLDLAPEARWFDLGHGVRVKCAPVSTSLIARARRDPAVREIATEAEDVEIAIAMAKVVARLAVEDWEGVGDTDGNPVPVTPEGLDALLELMPIFEQFQLQYMSKGLLLEQEKNGSALSPSGTSAGATDTAAGAPASAKAARRKRTSR